MVPDHRSNLPRQAISSLQCVDASVPPQIREVGLHLLAYGGSLEAAYRGARELGEPRLCTAVGFIEFQGFTKRFVLVLPIATAISRDPRIRASPKT